MGDVAALDQLIFKKTEENKRGIPEVLSGRGQRSDLFGALDWVREGREIERITGRRGRQ